jgi:hypothetical protein
MPHQPSWTAGQPVTGPVCWSGPAVSKTPDRWSWAIGAAAQDEIVAAAEAAAAKGFTADNFPDTPEAFPLPSMRETLAEGRWALGSGLGFAVLRNVPVDRLDETGHLLAVRGIGAHLGVAVSQNYRGEHVNRVMDVSDEIDDPRRYQAGGEFRMHIDPIDVVGLLCVRKARRGGESYVVSAPAVHNAILAERPDLIAALYEGFRLFRPVLDRGDSPALTPAPVPFFAADAAGAFASYCLPDPVDQAVRRAGATLTPQGEEALALLDDVAHRESLMLEMDLAPGDLQLLNNRVILHGRRPYEDFPDRARRRLMLRLWLMLPDWPAPDPRQRFFDRDDKAGGGIPKRLAAA